MSCPVNLMPVLLGGDLNAYSVALAFKEEYGINSHVFTKYKCGATENSRFITTHQCSGLGDFRVALPELLYFASKNQGARLLLVPCSDAYLSLLYTIKDALEGIYSFCIPREEDYNKLTDKASFHKMLLKNNISTPHTLIINSKDNFEDEINNFEYPAVIKPASSVEYYKHIFKGMKKVYFTGNKFDARETVLRIFSSGYTGEILLQEKINESATNYVLTTFSDKKGEVVRASLGRVVLEERGDSSYGNYSAIITEPLDMNSLAIIKMLNKISYTGIANFDIMREGEISYCLELNARQGRSCDYLRGTGINIAKYLVENEILKENIKGDFGYKEIFWHYPKLSTVLKNLERESDREVILRLTKEGRSYSPYENHYEGARRYAYKLIHDFRLARTFKNIKKRVGI